MTTLKALQTKSIALTHVHPLAAMFNGMAAMPGKVYLELRGKYLCLGRTLFAVANEQEATAAIEVLQKRCPGTFADLKAVTFA